MLFSKNAYKGFTLIELAIVLVIIGLLVGAVLAGQELIQQAKIRSQIAQFKEFDRATYTFKTKYNCLPGDCTNETKFINLSNCAFGNGNGDGRIYSLVDTDVYPGRLDSEVSYYPLSLYYTGLISSAPEYTSCMIKPIDSKIGVAFVVFSLNYINGYFLGANTSGPSTYDYLYKGTLNPQEAYSLDLKIDDGNAIKGSVYSACVNGAYGNRITKCTRSPACYIGSIYNLSLTDTICNLFIQGDF